MALLVKTVYGFVSQVWDTETKKWVSQDFVAMDDEPVWENKGEVVDEPEGAEWLNIELIQPLSENS